MEENKKTTCSNRIREFRLRIGFSQKQLAMRAGAFDLKRLSHYERGDLIPSLPHAMRLAVVLQEEVESIFHGLASTIRSEIFHNPKSISNLRRRVFQPEEDLS